MKLSLVLLPLSFISSSASIILPKRESTALAQRSIELVKRTIELAQPNVTMDLAQRDVYSPHITSPGHKSVWTVGSKQSVTWDVSDAPPKDKITNSKGQIMLGYKDKDGETQHLDFAHPIAKGFDIRDGQHTIVVPDVPDRKENYFIVLMGDSGNKSPSFKIIQGSNSVGGFGQPGGPEQGHQGGGQASTSGQGGAQKGGLLPGKLGGILPGV